MSGEITTPTTTLQIETNGQVTDPVLLDNLIKFEVLVQQAETGIDANLRFIDDLRVFDNRIDTIVTSDGETITDPEVIEASGYIMGLAVNAVARPLSEAENKFAQLPTVLDRPDELDRRVVLLRRPSHLSSVAAATGMTRGRGDFEPTRKTSQAINWEMKAAAKAIDVALAESRKDGPALSTNAELEILKPLDTANQVIHAYRKNHDTDSPEDSAEPEQSIVYGGFYRQFPSKATVEHIAFRAYVATLRTLRNNDDAGLFTTEARRMLKEEHNFSDESILAYEAARILELAPHMPTTDDGGGYGTYEMPIFKVLNIDLRAAMANSVALLTDKLSTTPLIPKEKQPAVAAQELMNELIRKVEPSEAWRNLEGTTARLKELGINKIVRPVFTINWADFGITANQLHQNILDHLNADPTEERLEEALAAEAYIINRAETAMERLSQTFFGDIIPAVGKITPNAVIHQYVEHVEGTLQLAEISEVADNLRKEISVLDEPYSYTSKKIRKYENGPVTLSSLKQALDKHSLLTDEDSRRTLAIMMLQAENASDPVAYFEELKVTRDMIELYFGELTFLGQDGQANVTNVLRWIDEMIDAGLENSVNHHRLKQFIQDYYLGVEEESLAVEAEPVVEEESPASTSEPEPQQNSDEAINEYMNYFADVLENVDVEFSDVSFFTKTGGGQRNEVIEGAQRPRGERFIDIDKRRLEGLVALKADFEHAGKSARLIFTESTKNKRIPYIALYVQEQRSDSTGVCFLENVEHGTATYGLVVDGTYVRDWDELHDYSLKEWRDDWGAKPIIHPDKASSQFMKHYMFDMKHYALTKLAQVNQ